MSPTDLVETERPVSTIQERAARVLIIEDTPEVLRAVKRSLKSMNVELHTATDGESGLAKVASVRPDLILSDVNMPGLSGFEILQAVRSNPATSELPMVLMTACDDRASIRRGMVGGADDYLTKPFTADEVREAVRVRLERHFQLSARLSAAEEALRRATHIDGETGLPNRRAFRDRLQALAGPEPVGAIWVLELDRFERLQSAFHPNQPEMMEAIVARVSERLQRIAATRKVVELYRLDTQRFGFIEPGVDEDSEFAIEFAEALLEEVRKPLPGTSLDLRLSASIGAAYWSIMESPLAVAGHAESAAYNAREDGGNHLTIYDAAQHDRAYNRVVLESSMHRALERNQFELYYQPQVMADTGVLTGMEALIRWQHPELGMVSPFHFIPIAEETGLIVPIGEWVMREACRQAASWSNDLPGVKVSVNLSALQLSEPNFLNSVLSILDETGLPANQLVLELTESMMIEAGKGAAAPLRVLSEKGCGVSIDDFGTGYSSLMNLRSFPINEVKIDRSFVRHVPDNEDNCSLVAAVIEMAHQLGLTVVAEGVEEIPQLEFLRERNCDVIQGYYFSKPLPPTAFLSWAQGYRKAA